MANLIGGVNKVSSFAKEGVYTSCNDHCFNLPLFASRAWVDSIPWILCNWQWFTSKSRLSGDKVKSIRLQTSESLEKLLWYGRSGSHFTPPNLCREPLLSLTALSKKKPLHLIHQWIEGKIVRQKVVGTILQEVLTHDIWLLPDSMPVRSFWNFQNPQHLK